MANPTQPLDMHADLWLKIHSKMDKVDHIKALMASMTDRQQDEVWQDILHERLERAWARQRAEDKLLEERIQKWKKIPRKQQVKVTFSKRVWKSTRYEDEAASYIGHVQRYGSNIIFVRSDSIHYLFKRDTVIDVVPHNQQLLI